MVDFQALNAWLRLLIFGYPSCQKPIFAFYDMQSVHWSYLTPQTSHSLLDKCFFIVEGCLVSP